jgi:hypothetical protein
MKKAVLLTIGYHLFQVAVGCSDNSGVDFDGFRITQSLDFTFLYNAQ